MTPSRVCGFFFHTYAQRRQTPTGGTQLPRSTGGILIPPLPNPALTLTLSLVLPAGVVSWNLSSFQDGREDPRTPDGGPSRRPHGSWCSAVIPLPPATRAVVFSRCPEIGQGTASSTESGRELRFPEGAARTYAARTGPMKADGAGLPASGTVTLLPGVGPYRCWGRSRVVRLVFQEVLET